MLVGPCSHPSMPPPPHTHPPAPVAARPAESNARLLQVQGHTHTKTQVSYTGIQLYSYRHTAIQGKRSKSVCSWPSGTPGQAVYKCVLLACVEGPSVVAGEVAV